MSAIIVMRYQLRGLRPTTGTSCGPADGANDPIYYLDLRNDSRYALVWWCGTGRPCTMTGPHTGESQFRRYIQGTSGCDTNDCSVKTVVSGQWHTLKMELKQSSYTGPVGSRTANFDGYVRFYQDDAKIFDLENVRTGYDNCSYNSWCANDEWAVNNYSDGLTPTPVNTQTDDLATVIP